MKDLNWANRENSQRPNNFDSEHYELINVNVLDIMKHSSSDFKLDPYDSWGGENAIGSRLPYAIEHFVAGRPMDYSEAYYSKYTKKTGFDNGRHRAIAAFQLGYEYVPMFVFKENIDKFKDLVRTKPLDNSIADFVNSKTENKLIFRIENKDGYSIFDKKENESQAFLSLYSLKQSVNDINDILKMEEQGFKISVYEIPADKINSTEIDCHFNKEFAKLTDEVSLSRFFRPDKGNQKLELREPRISKGKLKYY